MSKKEKEIGHGDFIIEDCGMYSQTGFVWRVDPCAKLVYYFHPLYNDIKIANFDDVEVLIPYTRFVKFTQKYFDKYEKEKGGII